MATLTETAQELREREAFETFIRDHFAQLCNISAVFTVQLLSEDREYFFEKTLETAWERRKLLDPKRTSIQAWWGGCCKHAALSRSQWTVWTITGPKVIQGKKLGVRP